MYFLPQALGLVLLGIGIWLVVVADDTEEAETITGDSYVAGGALLIVAGAVTLFVCGVGVVGAIFLWRAILIIVRPHGDGPPQWLPVVGRSDAILQINECSSCMHVPDVVASLVRTIQS